MNEKSAAGGSRNTAAAAAKSGVAVLPPGAPAGAVGAKVAERPGFPPRRPPDKLSQPSTFFEEVCADNSVGGHAALRVPDQPERLDVFFADLLDDEVDDVL